MKAKTAQYMFRQTTVSDCAAIMEVEKQAFGYAKEARLAVRLLGDKTAEPRVSLLAFDKQEAVGHILFSRICFNGQADSPLMHILAPLAVKPARQRQGVGGMLIQEGLRLLRAAGSELVFVLGHKEYYPKHGFAPDAARLGYLPPYPLSDENAACWMVQAIGQRGGAVTTGTMKCCDGLCSPEHWRHEASDRSE